MMKNMLILALVLGMASSANALILELGANGVTNGPGVDMTVNAGDIVEVVSDSDEIPYVRYLFAPDVTGADISAVAATSNAGTGAKITDYGDFAGAGTRIWEIQAGHAGEPPLDSIVAGIQFNVTAPLNGVSGVVQLLSEDLGTVVDSVTIIPEPASMLLIGLGGLFLRRRK
jgi:hypothetical protein